MDNTIHDAQRLKELQALPLERKIQITQNRIQEWYMHYNGNVYVSFSGGKDSTVLAHLTKQLFPEVPLVFINTGLEFTSVQKMARDSGAIQVYPEMPFSEVISTYGFPLASKDVAEAIYYARRITGGAETKTKRAQLLGRETRWCPEQKNKLWLVDNQGVCQGSYRTKLLGTEPMYASKNGGVFRDSEKTNSLFNKDKWLPLCQELPIMISHYCCNTMKKKPMKKYEKETGLHPIVATMAEESRMRKTSWLAHGCNAFDGKRPISKPMSFWTEQDVLTFIKESNIKIADAYGDIVKVNKKSGCKLQCTGCERTGCVYCGFGAQNKNDNRFLTLAELDPKKYEYSMNGGQWVDNPKYDATAPEYDGSWKNWNPKKIWVPSKEGLGLKKVFDMFNELYQNCKIKYEPDNDFERQMTIDDYV